MKDKLTQDVDETTYLLSSEKNAARIKESIAQLEQGVHIDEDGDLAVGSEKVGVASQGFADSLEAGMKFMGMDEVHTLTECVAIAILETSKGDSIVTYEYNDSCSVGTCWLLNEWVKPISNCGEKSDTA